MESLRLVGQAGSWARRPGWPGGDESRRLLLRYAAPAAFLLAVTVLALALRGGLRADGGPAAAHPAVKRAEASSAATRATPPAPKRWYVIQSGDTLGAIATRYGTTVDALLRLNPGVEPTALAPGSQVRIR